MTGTNIWDAVLARVETKVNRHSFYTWFKPTGFIAEQPDGIRVRVPNSLFRDWLTKHYSGVLDEALRGSIARERPSSSSQKRGSIRRS
jgi:chromosomal replication initiator protein